jgi:hypothetical protein
MRARLQTAGSVINDDHAGSSPGEDVYRGQRREYRT